MKIKKKTKKKPHFLTKRKCTHIVITDTTSVHLQALYASACYFGRLAMKWNKKKTTLLGLLSLCCYYFFNFDVISCKSKSVKM